MLKVEAISSRKARQRMESYRRYRRRSETSAAISAVCPTVDLITKWSPSFQALHKSTIMHIRQKDRVAAALVLRLRLRSQQQRRIGEVES
jgi:hypothetical protein